MIMKKQQLTPRSSHQTRDRQKVKVVLRVRPFCQSQQNQQFISIDDQNTIMINKPGYPTFMKFSYVQSEDKDKKKQQQSQLSIFNSVQDAVQCIFNGIDSTIFAYGQTGAGKTYTIIGNCPEINSQSQSYKISLLTNQRGILPRALERIFHEQSQKRDSRITISFFQIYNEKIYDLLNSTIKPLQIRELKSGQLSIPGLEFVEVMNIKQCINCLAEGIKNRVTSSTQGNIKSSRSHSIFHVKYQRLVINQQTGQHDVLVANLRIVDLAGSQKFNVPHDISQSEKQIKLLQLKSINGSLSKLGHCISALTSQARSHIPFRDSKLTRILSDSLMGSGKIRLIICTSPSVTSMNETASTLQFADRVKKAVFERPTLNLQKKKTSDYSQELRNLQKLLQQQRNRRIQLQKMLKQFLKSKNFQQQDLIKQNYKLRQQVSFLKEQIKIYSAQNKQSLDISHSRIIIQKQNDKSRESIKISPLKIKTPSNNASNNVSLGLKTSHLQSTNKYSQVKINENQNSASKIVRNGIRVSTQQYIKTPPKTSATRSVYDYHDGRSFDGSLSPHSKNNKSFQKGKTNNIFQNKIKKFIQNTDVDKDLQQKVRKRLNQIKKQLVQNQFQKNNDNNWEDQDVEKLWKK